MMHQPVENTAYCLNCANEWPAMWAYKELTLACPECRWRLAVPEDFVSSGWWISRGHDEDTSDANTETDGRVPSLWDRIFWLLKRALARRRDTKLFVEVPSESGPSYEKEIGDLAASERRSLHPVLRERVAERILDRYLAEQGYVDLVEGRRAYRKRIGDLVPADLPALLEADRQKAEEEYRREREQAAFAREVQAGLDRLRGSGARRVAGTGKEVG